MSKNTVRTDMIRSSGRPFIVVPADFIDNAGELSGQARWLYVLLTRLVNSEQNVAFPSYDYIQEKTGWARAVIRPALDQLIEKGWISVEKQAGAVNLYTVHVQAIQVAEASTSSGNELGVVQEMNYSSSGNELGVVQNLNSIYINTKYINPSKERTRSSGSKNPHYDYFADAYRRKMDYPYQNTTGDFRQYATWKKRDAGITDEPSFKKAVDNYLASPQGKYTFADLVTRFAVFRLSALDRFGKHVETKTPTPSSAAPLPRKTCGQCVNGYILPKTPQDRATKCPCQEVKNAITAS
jgi:hypothetical protein